MYSAIHLCGFSFEKHSVTSCEPNITVYCCYNYVTHLLYSLQREERRTSYMEKIGPQPTLNGEVCKLFTEYKGSPRQGKLKEDFSHLKNTKKQVNIINGAWTPDPSRLSGQRCAQLISVAMANKLEEVWISKQPILLFVYISQYFPSIFRW